MRSMISLILATAIFAVTTLEAAGRAAQTAPSVKTSTERISKLKEKLLDLAPGSMIEVRLLKSRKLRGKLGEIDDEGFNLTTVEQDKIMTRKIAFNELKSFKQVTSAKVKAGHTLLYILAGVGVVMIILIIWGATQTD